MLCTNIGGWYRVRKLLLLFAKQKWSQRWYLYKHKKCLMEINLQVKISKFKSIDIIIILSGSRYFKYIFLAFNINNKKIGQAK